MYMIIIDDKAQLQLHIIFTTLFLVTNERIEILLIVKVALSTALTIYPRSIENFK